MRIKSTIVLVSTIIILAGAGCSNKPGAPGTTSSNSAAKSDMPTEPRALPNEGFKAAISMVDPPAKLRAGEKVVVQVKIKNVSEIQWWARGGPVNTNPGNKFYIAAGNRWLKADGSLLTNMDGRYGISKNLKPGEEEEVPLLVTAPTTPGEYMLEVDLVQEGVAWFSDKGSPTAKTKITVAK